MGVGKRRNFVLSLGIACCLTMVAGTALGGNPKPTLTTPGISCLASTQSSITLQICGTGVYGAPEGFSIHMKTLDDFNVDQWATTGSYTCISLGGNCGQGNNPWTLSSGECVSLTISATTVADYLGQNICGVSSDCGIDPLLCGTTYVFRVFAHGGGGDYNASDKGPVPPLQCTTLPCIPDGGCTYTWGYWKTHGPEAAGCSPGNQENDWDVSSLTIGSLNLGEQALCDILHQNPGASACGKGAGANAVLILEHQLIAAMLNVENGAISCQTANDAIIAANALLAGREYDCVGVSGVLGQQMIAVKDVLSAYNNDICACPTEAALKPNASPVSQQPATAKAKSWGQLKSIYR